MKVTETQADDVSIEFEGGFIAEQEASSAMDIFDYFNNALVILDSPSMSQVFQ
jgi:hypothetical protein